MCGGIMVSVCAPIILYGLCHVLQRSPLSLCLITCLSLRSQCDNMIKMW